MSDLLFSEIDEELRREKAAAFWKRYGYMIAAAALFILALFGGWRSYQSWQRSQAATRGDQFFALVQKSENENSVALISDYDALAKTGSRGAAALARLRMAAEAEELGNRDQALSYYDALSREGALGPSMRDIAKLRAGFLELQNGKLESVKSRVENLATEENSVRHTARELLGLAAYQAKDVTTAKKWFELLVTDAEAPAAARDRGQTMLALLAADGTTPTQTKTSPLSADPALN